MFEHAEDGVQELAHDGDQGLHFSFAARDEVEVEGAQMGLMAVSEVEPRSAPAT